MDLGEEDTRKAKEAGSMLAINTDSHRPGNMEMIQLGVDLARRAGLERMGMPGAAERISSYIKENIIEKRVN